MSKMSLKAARVNAGMTLEDVSKRTHISKYTLSKYEQGISSPRWDTFLLLCSLYKQSCADIFVPTR